MIRISLPLLALGAWLQVMIPAARAQVTPLPAERCVNEINTSLAREQRIYRGVLFGVRGAAQEPAGATRFLRDGTAWIKTKPGTWVSASARDPIGDARIDAAAERDPRSPSLTRRGIFETKKVATSDLIPELTQTFRALQCRALAVCEAARKSQSGDDSYKKNNGFYIVKVPGCLEDRKAAPLPGCMLKQASAFEQVTTYTYCNPAAEQMLGREADMLKLAVSYDAAYRSLLQFTGTFDLFLDEFQGDLLTPLRQSMSLIGQLHRIPCFLAECNE